MNITFIRNLSISLIICFSGNIFAQELYMPLEIQQAYKNGTRSYDGKPGPKYFQNSAKYIIKAEFDPENKILKGKELITYYNNSTDILNKIVVRLYYDIFKKGNIRNVPVHPDDVNDGVTISKISVNDTPINLPNHIQLTRSGTNMFINPGISIKPRDKVNIAINWEAKIPSKTQERFGTYNSSSFFVAYWYPQIAVYDDIDGWDELDYTGTTEFYNDFNDFEVEISVPANYMVWATGKWNNPKDVLKSEFIELFNKAASSNVAVSIFTSDNSREFSINKKVNKFIFTANKITDFAFAASNEYLWNAVKTSDSVVVHSLYHPHAEDFSKVAEIGKRSVEELSKKLGISFPFSQMIAFNGEDGMEFPMMVNDGYYGLYALDAAVTLHEFCHQYFPFLVGTNEQKYAWMDEGLVTFLSKEIEKELITETFSFSDYVNVFRVYSGKEQEVPLMITSNQLNTAYDIHGYYRPATAFYFLKELMGDEKFYFALKEFIHRWKGKHPIPYDLFFTFNEINGESLNWYWDAWFFKPGYVDIMIENVLKKENAYEITLKNKGGLPVHVTLTYVYMDSLSSTQILPVDIWKNSTYQYTFEKNEEKILKEIIIDYNSIPDINNDNNRFNVN